LVTTVIYSFSFRVKSFSTVTKDTGTGERWLGMSLESTEAGERV